jgi:HAE1 family hydrophobic/amphiphilic exporter-1
MTLPELSVHRHVLAYMLSGVLVLFGLISYERIGVDRFPSIDFPMLSVVTTIPGANPDVVDASVTNIIESAVNSVSGIESIQSSSLPGVSVVRIQFELTKDIDVAFNEVQAKVNEVLRNLPEDADSPVVAKVEVGGSPVLWLVLQGDRTLQQLNQYARNVIKKRLETVNGVGEVVIGGQRDRTIRVYLDTRRMAALGVGVQDVLSAFRREHLKLPGGFLTSAGREELIKLDLEFHSTAALEQLVVMHRGHLAVRLGEIAGIEDGLADARRYASYGGEPAVGLGIVKISNANTVSLIDEVKRRLDTEILPQLPAGMSLSIATDDAHIILEIIGALEEHLLEGALLAALVVWLFLKNLRATLIIATAIPVSLLGAVAALYFSGYTFNVMTLLGLLLLIGVVVDDAIVVLENIFRHREEDPAGDAVQIAVAGANQVVFAVLAATFTLVSIFASVVFMGGIIGRFIQPFAVVVTLGVLVSLFVSVTLTPMLCARYLRVQIRHGRLYGALESGFLAIERTYRRLIELALRFRWTVLLLTAAMVMSTGFFMGQLGKGFMPDEDEGRFIVSFKTPLGSSLDYTRDRLAALEAVLKRRPEVSGLFSTIGTGDIGRVNQGEIFVALAPRAQRVLHQAALLKRTREDLRDIPGVQAFAAPVPIVSGQRGEPLQFVLKGPSLTEVARLAARLETRLRGIPEMGSLDMDLQLELPELKLAPDRGKAEDLGLDTQVVADALRVLAGGLDVAKYNDEPGDGERYDIRLKAGEGRFVEPGDLETIYLRNRDGQLVRLDTVARFEPSLGAAVITRYNLQYAANFYATPTIPEGDAAEIVKREAGTLLPPGYEIDLIGRAKEFGKTVGYLVFAFVTGIILVYMVLASQFNSFIQPVIIMVAQPLAIIGGVVGLWLVGHSLNIYSMIGLVLLVGLVAKNSILLLDLTNQLRAQGRSINEALLEACPIRMRPVLMTSLTIILALLPAALGYGAGADTNGPLAVAVIGGMVSSTLLTLVVVPSVYSLVEHGLEHFRDWTKQRKLAATPEKSGT